MPELPRRRTASAEGGVSLSDHSHRDSDSDGSFQWLFPRHIDLYHELWQLEDDGFYLDDDPLKISASARDAYGAYALGALYHRTSDAAVAGASADANNPDAATRAAPRAREFHARTTPIGPAPPGPAPPSRQVSLLDLHPADRLPMESVDRANARVPPVTVRWFWSIVGNPEFNLLREMRSTGMAAWITARRGNTERTLVLSFARSARNHQPRAFEALCLSVSRWVLVDSAPAQIFRSSLLHLS